MPGYRLFSSVIVFDSFTIKTAYYCVIMSANGGFLLSNRTDFPVFRAGLFFDKVGMTLKSKAETQKENGF